MSLINQALKKAQQERNSPPLEQHAEPTERSIGELRPTHAETRPGFQAMQIVVGVGILITGIVASVALTAVLLQPKPEKVVEVPESVGVEIKLPQPAEKSMPEQVTKIPAITPEEALPTPPASPAKVEVAQQTEAPIPPAPVILPEPTPVAQEKSPVVETTQLEEPVAPPAPIVVRDVPVAVSNEVKQVEEVNPESVEPTVVEAAVEAVSTKQPVRVGDEPKKTPPPPPETPLPGAEPNPKVLAFLESSRITGIKVAGVHSRLLMNNQIYRDKDIVHAETKLRITEILPNEIVFTDESGIKYRKQFRR